MSILLVLSIKSVSYECAYEFKPILYKLHKDYIEKLRPANKNINFAYVKEFIKTIPVKQLMFSINYHKREDKVTTNGEKSNVETTNVNKLTNKKQIK